MKLKISFDKKAIGNFFLQHTEKVVFILFLLTFASIIYGAVMRREKFDKTPVQLIEKCSTAERSFEGERKIELPTPDYKSIANKYKDNKNGINVEPYKTDVVWDSPVFPVRGKRGSPQLFDVQDLRAVAEFGAFQVGEAAGEPADRGGRDAPPRPPIRGERNAGGGRATTGGIHGKCWVVLTGLVPYEKQANAYKEAFRDAMGYDPFRDTPTYSSYSVERAEIKSPADKTNPNWQPCGTKSTEEVVTKEWLGQQNDVIDPKYSDTILTYPLGPLTKRKWGKNVAHEPEIPILSTDAVGAGNTERREVRVDRRGAGDPRGRGGDPRETTIVAEGEQIPEYKLFRFFDFNVEPGKSYIYRVQLVLNNPNYQVPASQLIDAQQTQKETLETSIKVAPSSSIIYVPTDTQILVDSVKPKAGYDYTGKVLLLKWMKTTGQEAYKDFRDNTNLERGQLLNFNNEKLTPVQESSSGPHEPQAQTQDPTNLTTDATLLDMGGGKKLKGRDTNLTEPGEMLLMYVRGNSLTLMTRDEMEDMDEVKRITAKPEEPTRETGRGAPTDRRGNPLLEQDTDPRREPRVDPRGDPRADPRRTPPTPPPTRTR
jgi:hypothetical protein